MMIAKFNKYYKATILLTVIMLMISCRERDKYSSLRLNEIQVIGSHNSYKIAIEKEIWDVIFRKDSNRAYSLQYEHLSISEQLNLGLRGLEIDLFHDPQGGRYADPYGLCLLKQLGEESKPFDVKNEMAQPGLKIFHIQDMDFRSHNLLFKNFLVEIKNWSEQNKNHLPVMITINAKDQVIDEPDLTIPLPFTSAALDSIDIEIKAVLPNSKLITPDLVKGSYSSLEKAVLNNGWPEIDSIRGRFMFVLDETGQKLKNYLNKDGSLSGKVMFVNSTEGNPTAAFRIVNDPVENENYIKELVKKGYIIRTRADADTKEARGNNFTRFNKAVGSGAQIITTDYYLPSRLFNSEYYINFQGKKFVKRNDFVINSGNR